MHPGKCSHQRAPRPLLPSSGRKTKPHQWSEGCWVNSHYLILMFSAERSCDMSENKWIQQKTKRFPPPVSDRLVVPSRGPGGSRLCSPGPGGGPGSSRWLPETGASTVVLSAPPEGLDLRGSQSEDTRGVMWPASPWTEQKGSGWVSLAAIFTLMCFSSSGQFCCFQPFLRFWLKRLNLLTRVFTSCSRDGRTAVW